MEQEFACRISQEVKRLKEKFKSPAEQLTDFLNFIDQCMTEYRIAADIVGEEDKRLQDLLHELEFSEGESQKNKTATKLKHSRKLRRENKDIVKRYELIVNFFEEQNNRNTLNKMRQLLGRQRKEEEFLSSKRIYKPRIEKRE